MNCFRFLTWTASCAMLVLGGVSFAAEPITALIVGGGSSHNFQRWFHLADKATLETLGAKVSYTENTKELGKFITGVETLFLCNNKAFEDQVSKDVVFNHVESGNGLVLVHPALWYNWNDWPEYNRELCGGGSRGHDRLGPFRVEVTQPEHPVMKGVAATFTITDELYYFEPDPAGADLVVLATAYSKARGQHFPVVFVVKHAKARIVGITLGHDGRAHSHAAYIALIKNATQWVSR